MFKRQRNHEKAARENFNEKFDSLERSQMRWNTECRYNTADNANAITPKSALIAKKNGLIKRCNQRAHGDWWVV